MNKVASILALLLVVGTGAVGCSQSDPAPTVTVVQTQVPDPTTTTTDSEDYALFNEMWDGGPDGFGGEERAYLCKKFKASADAGYAEFEKGITNLYFTKDEYMRFFTEHC
ncbi:MAG: hypothetical protein HQ526_02200 [Actinobacteria bacterium]|nr:hypothetical protein [Actinomycetota bacterium]